MFRIYFVFFRGIPRKNTERKRRNSGDFRHFFFRGNGNFFINGIPRKYGNGNSGTTLQPIPYSYSQDKRIWGEMLIGRRVNPSLKNVEDDSWIL